MPTAARPTAIPSSSTPGGASTPSSAISRACWLQTSRPTKRRRFARCCLRWDMTASSSSSALADTRPQYVLAADVGGTKTMLELGTIGADGYRRLHADGFQNEGYAGVAQVVESFLAACPERPASIGAACFALAGP